MIVDRSDIHEQPDGSLWVTLDSPAAVASPDRRQVLYIDPELVVQVGAVLDVADGGDTVDTGEPYGSVWEPRIVGQVRVVEVLPVVDDIERLGGAYEGPACIEVNPSNGYCRWWPAWSGALEYDDGRDIAFPAPPEPGSVVLVVELLRRDNTPVGVSRSAGALGEIGSAMRERTVRDALEPYETFMASDGMPGVRFRTAEQMAAELGIDPDMPVDVLRRRQAFAERVGALATMSRTHLGRVVVCDEYSELQIMHAQMVDGAKALLNHLTREVGDG